jgi:hypothetical protein
MGGCSVFREQFNQTGVFTYSCQIYTRMKGTIEVVSNNKKKLKHRVDQGSNPSIQVVTSVKDVQRSVKKSAAQKPYYLEEEKSTFKDRNSPLSLH